MKSKSRVNSAKEISKDISVYVDAIKFEEDNLFYTSIPSLEITGYGKNRKEADESLDIMLEEYFDYTGNHNTLNKELKKLGWKYEKKTGVISVTDFLFSISKNNILKDIVNYNSFRKESRKLKIPDKCLQD